MEIKNLKKAAERIKKAIKLKENIILYGDADMDGISAVVILKDAIENLEGRIKKIYFPDREKDGYGINKKALSRLKRYSPALLITLDCGIGNFKEVETAKNIGFEVIIIDHHEILGKIPKASIVVDPKQPGDRYPFKQFAAAGLAFRLAELLLSKKMSSALRVGFLELAAMATIADMMPLLEDNEKIVKEGLNSLKESWRPGLRALFDVGSAKIDLFNYLSLSQQASKINSLLNISDIEDGLPTTFRLLTASKSEKAKKTAEKLFEKAVRKKEKIQEIISFLEDKIVKDKSPIVFEGSPKWRLILLGTAASVLCQKCRKPVFLYIKKSKESPGSARGPQGFNVVEAMKRCSDMLVTYGGHPQAGGFRIKNENLERFKERLIKYFKKKTL
jgi:single-stranded-DNA-specific exonuclease